MTFEFVGIRDVGNLAKERVVLRALQDDDIGNYVLAQGRLNVAGQVSNDLHPLAWLPDKPVKAGDLIVVYTKEGNHKQKSLDDGGTSHFFYMDEDECVWGGHYDVAVLAHVSRWTYFVVPADEAATLEP